MLADVFALDEGAVEGGWQTARRDGRPDAPAPLMTPTAEIFARMAQKCRGALLDDVIPFWEKHSVDREAGGYLTCLGRDGSVYDTDKFVWLQARQVWMFSTLSNGLEKRDSWLEVAHHGAQFLLRHGRDEAGNWYFSLDRSGRPLVQPYSIFSDCFAATAFSQFALAAGDPGARSMAERTYANIIARRGDPKGRFSKAVPGTRPMVSLALPMILLNVTQELEWMLEPKEFDRTLDACVDGVFSAVPRRGPTVSSTSMRRRTAGSWTAFEGRLLNPGHGIEAMGFIMDVAERQSDRALADGRSRSSSHA